LTKVLRDCRPFPKNPLRKREELDARHLEGKVVVTGGKGSPIIGDRQSAQR